MRILYLAKHHSGGNQDEDAVAHALEVLGHAVVRVPESHSYKALRPEHTKGANFLLFHKCDDWHTLSQVDLPKVFWYFDLVDFPCPSLEVRNAQRKQWMLHAMSHSVLGFCTDGDWVERHWREGGKKLFWLPQGADERMVGRGKSPEDFDILFTGIGKGGGRARESFVDEMRAVWGDRFRHVKHNTHGQELKELIARARITVAPDSPVTPNYHSNRAYLSCGFGAFLLHPVCGLQGHYSGGEVKDYADRKELHEAIKHYLGWTPRDRDAVREAALAKTKSEHLYRHRIAKMLEIIEEKI